MKKTQFLIATAFLMLFATGGSLYANKKLTESFFFNYTTEHGLPHPIVNCIAEDNLGYIWVGTSSGLVRYDGIYFDVFNDKNSRLEESNITAIHQGYDKRHLWVGTNNGSICALDANNVTFQPLQYNFKHINPTGVGEIRNLFQYNDSILLVATNRIGLFTINIKTGSTDYLRQQNTSTDPLQVFNIRLVFGNVCIAAGQGIFTILQDSNQSLHLIQHPIKTQNASDLTEESDTTILVAINNELYRYNFNNNKSWLLSTFPDRIRNIICLPSNKIWLSTRTNGLYLYDSRQNQIQHHTAGSSKYSLQDNNIYELMLSKRKNIIWVGTKNGLSKLDTRHENIRYFDLNQYSDSKSANLFMLKYDSNDNYWFWSTDGLYRKEFNQNKFERVKPSPTYPNTDTILHAIETKGKELLFASTRGILRYTPDKKSFSYLPLKAKEKFNYLVALNDTSYCFLSNNLFIIYNPLKKEERAHNIKNHGIIRLQSATLDGDSVLWIGSNHGLLFRYHMQTNSITDTLRIPENEKFHSLSSITNIKMDNFHNLWIATYGSGLIKYDIDKNHFSMIRTSDQNSENIFVLEKDLRGNMWFNNSRGIVAINPQTNQQTIYSYGFYILSQEYNKGASDITPTGKIVMGGANGFNVIDPDDDKKIQYNQTPIITNCVLLPGNSYTFDSPNPQTIYNPKETIIIPKEFESIRIYVRFLNFTNSRKEKIAWKIDQIDTIWQKSNISSSIIYYNIPPGKHKMTITALDNNDNPTGTPMQIDIVRKVYFYRHPAFRIGITLVLFALVILALILRNKSLIRQRLKLNKTVIEKTAELVSANQKLIQSKEKITIQNNELMIHRVYLEELVKIRTRDLEAAKVKAEESDKLKTAFLANLSHEIRTPMNSIMGFTSLLGSGLFSEEEKTEFIQHIHNSSESLLVLISDIIDVSRIETGQINLILSELNIETDLALIVRSLKFEKTESLSEIKISFDPSCKNKIAITDKERFKQIVINLVKNAIKFTKNGEIELTATIISRNELLNFHYPGNQILGSDKILLISVDDHGIGIAPENQSLIFEPFRKVDNKEVLYPGIGLGLSIVKNLIKLLNGEVWLRSEIGKGSTFYFYIPEKSQSEPNEQTK